MTKRKNLTLKQEKFVHAYLGEARGNATQAARLAGYSGNDNTLRSLGAQNLAKRAIKEAVETAQRRDRTRPKRMTNEEALEELRKLALDPELKVRDRIAALNLLLKAGGAFVAQVEVRSLDAMTSLLEWLRPRLSSKSFRELVSVLSTRKD
jgi:phage terminase small subunit